MGLMPCFSSVTTSLVMLRRKVGHDNAYLAMVDPLKLSVRMIAD